MNQQRFDDLARLFARGLTRRGVIKGVAGSALGAAAAGVVSRTPVSAGECLGVGGDCSFGACCGGLVCVQDVCRTTCASQGECEEGESCFQGACFPDGICGFKGDDCENSGDCCDGFLCSGLGCLTFCESQEDCEEGEVCQDFACFPEVTCNELGGDCAVNDDCCEGLVCDTGNEEVGVAGRSGTCELPVVCIGEGEFCDPDGNSKLGCCDDLVCNEQSETCEVVADAGTATVTIHLATCPSGTADLFGDCHDNGLGDVDFTITSDGEVSVADTGDIVTDDDGVAAAVVDAGGVTVAEDADVVADYLGAYVFCSEQNSGAVLFDGNAASGAVSFTVADGDEVICDWYNITEADDDDDDEDDDEEDDDVTTLPTTGSGPDRGSSWLGAAAAGGAAAVLLGKKLRDDARPAGETE